MFGSPFQAAIQAVLKPLEFAARDDFAHLERVRDLERSVLAAARRAAALAVPHDVRDLLQRIEKRFEGPLDPARTQREMEQTQ